MTNDKNKLEMVTEECLQLIKYIGNKIGEVEVIKYEEKENKEEWKYKEFNANEYQTDLFFIRNSDRIMLIFNVIKKKCPDITRYRCQVARLAMQGKCKIYDVEKKDQIIP
jgi:hypothetical protein